MNQSNQSQHMQGMSNDGQDRIDLNNYVPDQAKRNDLKRRLYDSGISNIPMPSVKRPIEENISSRPFSARMNSNKIQSLSPLKKKIQDLNTNIISNLNESYKQAAIQEAKYQGEGTAEYYRSQQVVIPKPSTFSGTMPGLGGKKLVPKMGGKSLLSQSKKAPMHVPPIDEATKNQINQRLNRSGMDNMKIMQGPPAMLYSGFEGGVSLSQKNLEQARSKFLLDKLTGKLPPEYRGGMSKQLPPLHGDASAKQDIMSRNSALSVNSQSRQEGNEGQKGQESDQKEVVKKDNKTQKWSDLDKYIELLLDSKSEEETVFLYLSPNPNNDPYDLIVGNYQEKNESKYYTLSGKGLTLYENDTPIEFLSLGQWLIERDSYNHIKDLPFFQKFKKWKFMRMWKKTIKHNNRMKAQNALTDKLFMLQNHYSTHLAKHREYMIGMEKCKFVNSSLSADTYTIDEFSKEQGKARDAAAEQIASISEKSRENIRECIQKVLEELRDRIVNEIALDEERKKSNPIQSSNTITMKRKASSNVFEKLGFPEGMTYGHRSNLRKECSKFLRFAYLADFLALESLSNIYKISVQDMIDRLKELDSSVNMQEVMTMDFDEQNQQGHTQHRGKEPLFYVGVSLSDKTHIPEDEIKEAMIDDFILPPRGTSKEEDFDLLTHLQLEPEVEEGEEEGEDDGGEGAAEKNLVIEQLYKKIIPNIHKFWLEMVPDENAFTDMLDQCFNQGLEKIQCFERWSKHNELTPYADALEEWDDIVGDVWEEPDTIQLNPYTWINEDALFTNKKDMVKTIMSSAFKKSAEFSTRFQVILEIYWRNMQVDFNILVDEKLKNPVESLSNTIKLLNYYTQFFNSQLPSCTDLGLLQIDSKDTRAKLQPTPKEYIKQIEELIPRIIRERTDEKKNWLTENIRNLKKQGIGVEEYVQKKKDLESANDNFQNVRDGVDLYGQFYNVLAEFQLKVKKEDKDNFTETVQLISTLANKIQEEEGKQDQNMEAQKKTLNELIPKLNKEIDSVLEESLDKQFVQETPNIYDVLKKLDDLEIHKNELEETAGKYNYYQEQLQVQPTIFENLDSLREELSIRCLLWRSLKEWEEMTEEWLKTDFKDIDANNIKNIAEEYAKKCLRLEKNLEDNPIQSKLKVKVDTFKLAMPIVMALRNENLEDNHRQKINEVCGVEINVQQEGFTLQSLIDLKITEFQEEISAISTAATQEAKLRAQLQQENVKWSKVEIETKPFKNDNFVLDKIDDMYQNLDDSMANINMILGSRFVKPLRDEAEKFKKNLNTLNALIEEWTFCQKQWIYLENIFQAGDIKKQLTQESAKFEQVDKFFKGQMVKCNKFPNAMRMIKQHNFNLVDQFKQANETLDDIQKRLEDYLENKRGIFPRFYFLSNDELLEILAHSQDLDIIRQHLKTCFDNLVNIDVDEEVLKAMISNEGEKVIFSRPMKIRGAVEAWLLQLQDMMKDQLLKEMKRGYNEYNAPNSVRKEWVRNHPGQIVATIAQVDWCMQTEGAISAMETDLLALTDWLETNRTQLSDLSDLVSGDLNKLERKVIVALVTTDVHARDIVEELKEANVNSVFDFNWQKQLRYYWDDEKEDCSIKQIQSTLKYGYEYMGATSRLVITPLTDRCWITITGALHIKLGANPAGPAGTGKTESTKDLAKALATLCIVFNCSDQVDYLLMARHFSGLSQQGAWTCLDEFNRIDIEVLSVIAQQLQTVRKALMAGVDKFMFEDKEIKLEPTFGVHVTMNPGYAGRTELPDNLKVLFRPVAMMIPDYALIAEIMLFAEGFKNCQILSQKMVQLYKLSSEQLSQQDHYDFGMRALKSVLVMAGDLKRKNKEMIEDAVLIRAMRDSNVPKFLKDDLPLFAGIIQDLFPKVEIESVDYGDLKEQVLKSIESFGLQCEEDFTLKVIQLFETFNVRFGVMLVGLTGGGKTTCYEVLEHTMTTLRQNGHPSENYQEVKTTVFNPKAITMGELYGEVNQLTQEWTDGLASKVMRIAAQETGDEKSWVVFDGPVDALWIENMNTVLDDNMTLCLANGQRIKLRAPMRMLFEVQDLAVASPATVSRCGMVYLTPEQLGWRPFVKTWIKKYFGDFEILSQELMDYMWDNMNQTIDVALTGLRNGTFGEPIITDNLQQVRSMCNFIEILTKPSSGFVGGDEDKKKWLNAVMAVAYTWGIGGSVNEDGKDKFDTIVRDQFKAAPYPPAYSVFDYYFNMKGDKNFKLWSNKRKEFEYDKDMAYFEMVVPTDDTTKYSAFMEQLLSIERNLFFTGLTGVGKSVIVQSTIDRLKEKDLMEIIINFSAQTSSLRTQQSIMDKLEKKRRTLYGAKPGKKLAIFVDDINMPAKETYGAQPPIELLRLFIDRRGLFKREDWSWFDIEDTTLVAAAAPPTGGRSVITPRFTTHFNMFCVPNPSGGTLGKIFGDILKGFLKNGFVEQVQQCQEGIISSTIEIYNRISSELRATPAKFHYVFNLRDVSKVIQGILMSKPASIKGPEDMSKLWLNEVLRIFSDRLINEEDKEWFIEASMELLGKGFRNSYERNDLFHKTSSKLMFGDILKLDAPVQLYEELTQLKPKLLKALHGYLDDYNMGNSNKMNLVLFDDAVDHILRISRVLRQPRGNIMCIGVGGSGKQSLIRLSSHMLQISYYQIELIKGYGNAQFQEDMKNLMFRTGIDGEKVSFVMTDTQIISESFIEDINNMLNTGEIPNLYLPEDKDKIVNSVREIVIQMKKLETVDNINFVYNQRVREKLHICLCMSPVGDTLRIRCRQFPSLVNCCTLNLFSRWPEDALLYVSSEFLRDLELPSDEIRTSLAEMCMIIHTSVENASEKFYDQLRRRVYTTPKSYLDLISLYLNLLEEQRDFHQKNRHRLASGLNKLNVTNERIAELKIKLAEMAPVLIEKNEELRKALEVINAEKKVANEKERVVSAEGEVVSKKAAEAGAIRDDAQADLKAAEPELLAARSALDSLNKDNITEIAAYTKPNPLVLKVLDCIMVYIGAKTGWDHVKSTIKNVNSFLQTLKAYKVEDKPESLLTKIRKKYLNDADFEPEGVGKISGAAKSLCIWAISVSKYQIVVKKIEPKKQKLKQVEEILDKAQSELDIKMTQLAEVKKAVAKLEADCDTMKNEKETLEFNMDKSNKQMGRAEKLVVLLADEGVRWKQSVEDISVQIEELVGNVFLSCACISYFGAFTGTFRHELTSNWTKECIEKGIPTSDEFSLVKVMGDPVTIRSWNIAQLPTDQVSTENGILATKAERWSLCIDPQQQANKWIKNMTKDQHLLVLKFGPPTFLRDISGAIRNGRPCLIEDVEEIIDPAIDPILLKQAYKTDGGMKQMRLGDANLDYDDDFKFFMTTKMPNPHYLPEVCIKVTLINFTVTFEGLQEQLLGDVVGKERSDIEKQKDEIIVSMAQDQKTLQQIENTILKLLNDTPDEEILDGDELIETLESSKKTSAEINERMDNSIKIEEEINFTRAQYTSVSTRGSVLYFVIADLAGIDPMYQNSLVYIKSMFNTAIDISAPKDELADRLTELIKNITEILYTNISRGLFEKDKIIYSFLITTSIMRNADQIKTTNWNSLLRGASVITQAQEKEKPQNPDTKLIGINGWDLLYSLECNEPEIFPGITTDIIDNHEAWHKWYTTENPHQEPLPGEWNESLTSFQKLIVLRAFRPEKLLFGFQKFVIEQMGKFFVEAPQTGMEIMYKGISTVTPLVFVLSQGADPTQALLKFADDMGFGDKLNAISLGQGQGKKAEAMIAHSKKEGEWVMLQNCHLAKSWMSDLEQIVLNLKIEEESIHEDFRLYMTSMPASYFPVSVLQNSVKLTTEPPRGIRANVKRTYMELNDKYLDDCAKPEQWRKLLFGVTFFHATIQERRKFGPLGWNIKYEFNDSDLQTSFTMLKIFLDEQNEIPWDALVYQTGHINYGGRVTDDWDRRCLLTMLQKYYNPDILEDSYKFNEDGTYFAPQFGSHQSYLDYIETLPLVDKPDIFGLHDNADITFQNQESTKIIDTILSIQPRVAAAAGGLTPDEIVLEKIKDLTSRLPAILDREEGLPLLFKTDKNGLLSSLTTVLLQEMIRFNKLLRVMMRSLQDLDKAINGFIVMSAELDKMYVAFQNNQVPPNWSAVGYLCLKPLSTWYLDLIERIAFFENWLKEGQPRSFWISGFFFPQGFMTGVLQTHARSYQIAIDKLKFSFEILVQETAEEIEEEPEDGVYIYGLFMDGARWDRETMTIADQHPSEMYDKMPVIHFKPQEDFKRSEDDYACPCYKTTTRAGVLSTTGQSTNYIVAIDTPSQEHPKLWVQRAAAFVCMLND